ncbi:hypothetical protein [Streptomyces violascens]|uniref:Uncharacterized protein n=1 Tax=Streptomyces violascens TaxID=67381 RepID=A0ABQ3QRV8_9ACTN|nr:hypothetical protein [Streptomyces violascens]GGT84673.1 hypothetical protein GCM10010289_00210 [Streptomyces violascens]GHI40021.1 hypothetical protein Sviol_44290 [Streptomyces violascens]
MKVVRSGSTLSAMQTRGTMTSSPAVKYRMARYSLTPGGCAAFAERGLPDLVEQPALGGACEEVELGFAERGA